MTADELERWSRDLLGDFDAVRPWRTFVPPAGMTLAQAYAVQAEVARLREARGERVIGYKVGCTSAAVRAQVGIDAPVFARVFDTGWVADGARVAHADFANFGVEGELAVRLGRDLPASELSDAGCLGAFAAIFPVIELHHYTLPADAPPAPALIASGAIHAGFVSPADETACSGRVPAVDSVEVEVDGRVLGVTNEPWTMGGPAATLRWLAARLAESGLRLRGGQVILTGAPLPLYPVGPGARVVARARPLGEVSVAVD